MSLWNFITIQLWKLQQIPKYQLLFGFLAAMRDSTMFTCFPLIRVMFQWSLWWNCAELCLYHNIKFHYNPTVEFLENIKTPSVVWISCDRPVQHKHPTSSHVSCCLKKGFADPFGGIVDNHVYYNNVKLHHDPTVESPANFKTPSVVWISRTRAGQHEHPTCSRVSGCLKKLFSDHFGGIVWNCVYYNLVKFRDDPMVQSPAKSKTRNAVRSQTEMREWNTPSDS